MRQLNLSFSAPDSNVSRFIQAIKDKKNLLILHMEANALGEGVQTIPGLDRIIQIGLCLLDSNLSFIESGDIVLNPSPDTISPYAARITGIPKRKSLRWGYFPDAHDMFLSMYNPENTVLCSFWDSHIRHFISETDLFGLQPPEDGQWVDDAIDIKSLVASTMNCNGYQSLESIMEHLDLDPVGHFHDAGNDALHVSMILSDMFENSVS